MGTLELPNTTMQWTTLRADTDDQAADNTGRTEMAASDESLIFHDATAERLSFIVESVAAQLRKQFGWKMTTGDVPNSTGLLVPISLFSWGERMTIAVEEKSVRVVSECRFPIQVFDRGKNRANIDLVRRRFQTAASNENAPTK